MAEIIDIPKEHFGTNIDEDSFAITFRAVNTTDTPYRVDFRMVATNDSGEIIAEEVRGGSVFESGEIKYYLSMGPFSHNEPAQSNVTVCVDAENEIALTPP